MKRMAFEKIDINGWKRREYFEHYFKSVYKELHADHETGAADNK